MKLSGTGSRGEKGGGGGERANVHLARFTPKGRELKHKISTYWVFRPIRVLATRLFISGTETALVSLSLLSLSCFLLLTQFSLSLHSVKTFVRWTKAGTSEPPRISRDPREGWRRGRMLSCSLRSSTRVVSPRMSYRRAILPASTSLLRGRGCEMSPYPHMSPAVTAVGGGTRVRFFAKKKKKKGGPPGRGGEASGGGVVELPETAKELKKMDKILFHVSRPPVVTPSDQIDADLLERYQAAGKLFSENTMRRNNRHQRSMQTRILLKQEAIAALPAEHKYCQHQIDSLYSPVARVPATETPPIEGFSLYAKTEED